jgi:lipopolysaccharide biosynthesis glycosyltransferase
MRDVNKPTNAMLISLDSKLKFQSIALVLNILETQPVGTRIIVFYAYEDESDRSDYLELLDRTFKHFRFENQRDCLETMFLSAKEVAELTNTFLIPAGSYITNATFLRLFISELLPNDVEKVLYLDIDILINSNLEDLFSLDFSTPICAAINVPGSLGRGEHLEGHNAPYFNSGVLLINMGKWRTMNLLEHFIKVGSQKEFPFVDQDILNIVFRDNWTHLGREYNYLHLYGSGENDASYCAFPSIIHFAGNKPWNETPVTQFVSKYRKNFNRIRPLHDLLRDFK